VLAEQKVKVFKMEPNKHATMLPEHSILLAHKHYWAM